MDNAFEPVTKQRLSDGLAQRVIRSIHVGNYQPGDRLPSIAEMARRFGVGHATLREALKKLETVGVVTIKHGAGVYVDQNDNTMFISNPVFDGVPSKKLLLELVEARIPIETRTVAAAAEHATEEQLEQIDQLISQQEARQPNDDGVLPPTNMAFHRRVAEASGTTVLYHILEAISNLFQREQQMVLNIYSSQHNDHEEHREILKALQQRDERLAVERMQAHLEGVREVLLQWDPDENPVR